jgi:shikimate kinase
MTNGKIFLIGPKHSGKTSVGKVLASLCSCGFIDLDDSIKQRTGKSPRQLYSENPAEFQKAETEALADIIRNSAVHGGYVIATGGGIIDNPDAVTLLQNSGVLVYLKISADTAWNRIANSADGELPPFLGTENPQETHRALHERRASACHSLTAIIVETEGKTPEESAGEIFRTFFSVDK